MKATYSWLKEYCPAPLSAEEAADRLTMSGLEVEELRPTAGDHFFEVEVTTNRPDLLGVIGIARELSALTGTELKMPPTDFEEGESVDGMAAVEVQDAELCPRYTARVITGVKVGPSPAWLVERLESIGLRSVNNVVDVTNFVLMECGQPLHAFDLEKLRDRKVVVRRAADGETMLAIDGRSYDLNSEMLVIAGSSRPVAVAGVMGGLETEVSESTTSVLLESAEFESTSVRRTSRVLGLSSDSSYRFERGVDPEGVEWASRRAARLIRETAGGEIARGVIDVRAVPFEPRDVGMRISRLNALIGRQIPAEDSRKILKGLGFAVRSGCDERLIVTVPSHRNDVTREVDLIEEVARIYGYDKVPARTTLHVTVGRKSTFEVAADKAGDILTGLGFCEVVTNSFADAETSALASPWTDDEAISFSNPVRSHECFLRRMLLPSLLAVKNTNQARGTPRVEIFEIGTAYLPRSGEKLPEEQTCLAVLEEDGFFELKGVLDVLAASFLLESAVSWRPLEFDFFESGRAAELMLDGERLAVMGEVSRVMAERYDLSNQPFAAEVNFDLLVRKCGLDRVYKPFPVFPSVMRDLAVIVGEEVAWSSIVGCVEKAAPEVLQSVQFFDIYRGKQVASGKKSIAFSLTFQAADRTLTGAEVDVAVENVVQALKAELGADLRRT